MTVLGVDFGQRRVGLARGTDDAGVAAPWRVLRVSGRDDALNRLTDLVRDEAVTRVVFGLPLSDDGSATDMSRRVQRLARVLGKRTGVAVVFEDEWGTSRVAQAMDGDDAVAAAVILQSHFDRSRGGRS